MRKKKQISGLFLWAVKVRGSDSAFWITTRADSIMQVLKKLPAALKRNELDARECPVRMVEFHGTIDG